jgi:hypothetical protein
VGAVKNEDDLMLNRQAITKLKAVLIVDLIITAFAFGGYFYVQSTFERPKSAAFVLSDLVVSPSEADFGQPVTISVNVTNLGEEAGSYSVNLLIDDASFENKTVQLPGAESVIVEFTVDSAAEGSHSVTIEDLTGSFTVIAAPPPPSDGGGGGEPTSVKLSSLKINPLEGWPGVAASISVEAKNSGGPSQSTSVSLYVGSTLIDSKDLVVPSGLTITVRFSWTPPSEGSYSIKVSTPSDYLILNYKVVPSGLHTLSVTISPSGNADFTVDGKGFTTPYAGLFSAGLHTVAVEPSDPTGTNLFIRWEDGSTSPTRVIGLSDTKSITAFFTGGASSCPALYVWNGNSYDYVAEVSNHGWLGYINYVTGDPDWPIVYWRNNPWDYIPLNNWQLQPIAGTSYNYYDMKLTQRWNEIFYLDAAYMVVVDHPADVNVYSTMVEQYLNPDYMGNIYTVSKNPLTPISAVNEKGENVLPQISAIDDVFTPGIHGIQSPEWNETQWNTLTLNLGDLSGAQQIKLVIRGMVDWGSADDYNNWIDKFFAPDVPAGTQITPAPYMEVKNANGDWVRVQEDRQFPIAPEVARTFVVDLTGLFPTDDYSLRISNFWNVTFDYIGVDTTSQQNITIQKVYPIADLHQYFSTTSAASGNFTKYGDVSALLREADDMYVIGKQGDEVHLQFPTTNLTAVPEGMQRDLFFYVALWFKDEYGNWGYGFPFEVDPMPFLNMSGFPYPLVDTAYFPGEAYPTDSAHLAYLAEWNTRVANPP